MAKIAKALVEEISQKALVRLFDEGKPVMRKEREHYTWKQSKVVLDNIVGVGQFIEFYPINDEDRQILFIEFGVGQTDLITESYYSLSLKK